MNIHIAAATINNFHDMIYFCIEKIYNLILLKNNYYSEPFA